MWTPENIAALVTGVTGLVTALVTLLHGLGVSKVAAAANATANEANGRSKAITSAVLSTPKPASNTPPVSPPDQGASVQPPAL